MTDETTKDAAVEGVAAEDVARDGAATQDVATEGHAAPAAIGREPVGDAPPPPGRGSIAIYAVAFGLMVLAAVCLMAGALGILSIVNVAETSFFGAQRILRISAVLSGIAIVAAIVAVLAPRRSS